MNALQIITVLRRDAGHQQHGGGGYENTGHPTTPCDHAELFGNKHGNNKNANTTITTSTNKILPLPLTTTITIEIH